MLTPSWINDGSEIPDPFGYGERAVQWLRKLKHPKNPAPGHPFQLDEWQERIIRAIYGPRHPDGTRIVRSVFLLLPRGNRKTSLAAAIALLELLGPEKVPGALVQSAASARKQARECFEEIAVIVNSDKRIAANVRIQDYKNRIIYPKHRTRYEALSADAGVHHGSTPSVVIADELHAWKGRELWDVLSSALNKTDNTLMVIATTAGRGQANIAYEQYAYARKVQTGEIDDPSFLPVIFEAGKDDDWRDEALWHKVNPGLAHGYPSLTRLRLLAKKAEHSPGDREMLQQLHLNVWLDGSLSPFIDMADFDACAFPVDPLDLQDQPCWIGVDMSSTTDLTAVVACFRDDDGSLSLIPHFFVPGDNLEKRAKQDQVPYPRWADEGFITATPGNAIDYSAVTEYIRELCATYDVRQLAFDRAYAQPVMGPLIEDGMPVITLQQGWVTQSPALNELERAIITKTLRHGGNPVLRWNFENIAIQTDSAGNRTMHKGKSKDRIDGAVATWMAVKLAAANDNQKSFWDSDGAEELAFIA